MYTDMEKNLFMFMPEDISDEEIVKLGEICFPEIEAKAKNINTKSSKTVLKNKDHYGETKLIKIGDYNIGSSEDTLTIPHYMTFLLSRFNLDY